MTKKTKQIFILIISLIIWVSTFVLMANADNTFERCVIIILNQISLWFGWLRSWDKLLKIRAAQKLLNVIWSISIKEDIRTYSGLCALLSWNRESEFHKYQKYIRLLNPIPKQQRQLNSPYDNAYWFRQFDWDTRIQYLNSYIE